jgi:hypothetical protein
MTQQGVIAIMKQRALVTLSHVGKRIRLLVQGNGNVIDVTDAAGELVQSVSEPGTVLRKKIFNLRANSEVAMKNPRTRQILVDALAAEKAGDTEKASELFNDYLNKTQVSVGVLLPSAVAEQITANTEIIGTVEQITTEKGSLLSLDPKTIAIAQPEEVKKAEFSLEELTGVFGDDETAEVPAEADAAKVDA